MEIGKIQQEAGNNPNPNPYPKNRDKSEKSKEKSWLKDREKGKREREREGGIERGGGVRAKELTNRSSPDNDSAVNSMTLDRSLSSTQKI